MKATVAISALFLVLLLGAFGTSSACDDGDCGEYTEWRKGGFGVNSGTRVYGEGKNMVYNMTEYKVTADYDGDVFKFEGGWGAMNEGAGTLDVGGHGWGNWDVWKQGQCLVGCGQEE